MKSLKVLLIGMLLVAAAGMAVAVEGDIVFKREGGGVGIPPALFPHWFHRIRYKCYVCHPALFEMKAGANRVSMDALAEGKFCGVCHNRETAWGITLDTCNRCHIGQ